MKSLETLLTMVNLNKDRMTRNRRMIVLPLTIAVMALAVAIQWLTKSPFALNVVSVLIAIAALVHMTAEKDVVSTAPSPEPLNPSPQSDAHSNHEA